MEVKSKHPEIVKTALKDSKVKQEYDALQEEFELLSANLKMAKGIRNSKEITK